MTKTTIVVQDPAPSSIDMKTFYHVTPRCNIPNIKKRGLIPQIGPLSKKSEEIEHNIYVFDNPVEMQDAITNWLGDCFSETYGIEDDDQIAVIKINIPDDFTKNIIKNPSNFEIQLSKSIPPEYLTYFDTFLNPLP